MFRARTESQQSGKAGVGWVTVKIRVQLYGTYNWPKLELEFEVLCAHVSLRKSVVRAQERLKTFYGFSCPPRLPAS